MTRMDGRDIRNIVIVALVLGLWSSTAAAQGELAPVRLNGMPVLEVAGSGEEPARARADRIERRLQRISDRPDLVGAPDVVPGPTPDSRVIELQGLPIVTLTRADAEEAVTTVDALAADWAASIGRAIDQARASRVSPWRRISDEVRGSISIAASRLGSSAARIVPRALAALAVLALFWVMAATVRATLRLVFRRVISDLTIENLFKQLAYYAVWAIGILVAADVLGFEPGAVITGLGLTGLALGFALKDIISNFVSGIIILGLRPFEIGDEIVVGQTEGTVQRIELRATAIRTYDGRLVLVPNAELFTSRVTNNTAAPVRRAAVEIPVGYGTDFGAAEQGLLAAARKVPAVLAEPAPSVRLRQLGPADVLMELRFWTDSRRADLLATMSSVRRAVVETFQEAGIPLPEPDLHRLRFVDSKEDAAVRRDVFEGSR